MRSAKLRSTVELLGRKQLGPGSELPLTPADPASRILEALLNMPDQAERTEMLPAALQPPDPCSAPSEVCCSLILLRMHAALSVVADLPAVPVQGINHAHE